jgi:heme-degrading monooxygenase HmoA
VTTLAPPYFAVIFTSQRSHDDAAGYAAMAERMSHLAAQQPGFLGEDSLRDENGLGITISYWASLESIAAWKADAEHRIAQELGQSKWYASFRLRTCRVERDVCFPVERGRAE